jgi:hypothetical protein
MAFATDTFRQAGSFNPSAFRVGKPRGALVSALAIGVGIAATVWVLATVSTTQKMVASLGASPAVLRHGSHALDSIALVDPNNQKVRRPSSAALAALNPELRHRIPHGAQTDAKNANTADRVVVSHDDAFAEPASALVMLETSPLSESDVTALLNTPSGPVDAEVQNAIRAAMVNSALALAANGRSAPALDSRPVGSIPLPANAPDREKLEIAAAGAALATASDNPFNAQPDLVDKRRHEPEIPILASYAPSATESNPMMGPLAPDLEVAVPVPEDAPDRKTASVAPDDAASSDDAQDTVDVPLPSKRPKLAAGTAPAAPTAPAKQRPDVKMASIRPDDAAIEAMPRSKSLFGSLFGGSRNGVAVYDISARTVYLPNGERLEAHSGMGHMLDNPRYTRESNRGPTPPHTYNLTMREQLFHGVAAIRLTPVDGRNAFGRNGLLAHTYMLGPRGDSNGCVVFKDYRRFLKAFQRGEVSRLVVVERMSSFSRMATR